MQHASTHAQVCSTGAMDSKGTGGFPLTVSGVHPLRLSRQSEEFPSDPVA